MNRLGMGGGPACSRLCGRCLQALKWLPVLFIMAIVGWSYYAYVVQLSLVAVAATSVAQAVVYLALYHLLLTLFLWSYAQTIFTRIGKVPRQFKLSLEDQRRLELAEGDQEKDRLLEELSQGLPLANRGAGGAIRFCDRCHHIKPDRAHHCSVCGTCVLKMDHHCPWVNNCVSFTNYKYFILFLAYALIYCLFVFATALPYFVLFWQGGLGPSTTSFTNAPHPTPPPPHSPVSLSGAGRFHVLFLFFVAAMFALSLVSLFAYHCYLVAHNRTTLEAFRAPVFRLGPDKNGFSLGKYNNFLEVFGHDRKKWFLPLATTLGDGVVYPTQLMEQGLNYETMGCP